MDAYTTAAVFLTRHNMHPEQMPFAPLCARVREEMERGLRGEPSSLGMFPSYLHGSGRLLTDTPALVIDAGGTNLRVARVRFTADGRAVTEVLRKSRMPGTRGEEIGAEEMFRAVAAEALEAAEGCERACISFSYPCEVLPGGDGRTIRLTKELHVRGLVGSAVCAPLEAALRELGAKGERRWRLINDTVGSMLGGMAESAGQGYADYVGLILGTGTNTCCSIPAADIRKSPAAMAMGGDVIVNLESGGFHGLLQGDGDRILDEASEEPGAQWAEKMISGGYYPPLLRTTLRLAASEGLLSAASLERLTAAAFSSRDVDLLCRADWSEGSVAAALPGEEERALAHAVNDLLLERAARITAAVLAAILARRGLPEGARACVCADGTTFARNPVLRPRVAGYLRRELTEKQGPAVEFLLVSDATLLGSAYAGLLE